MVGSLATSDHVLLALAPFMSCTDAPILRSPYGLPNIVDNTILILKAIAFRLSEAITWAVLEEFT